MVVVTRYFGGIKLGGGGLIRAYGKATTEGLFAAQVVERKLHHVMKVTIDYNWLGKIENEIRSSHYELRNIEYTDGVDLFVYVAKNEVEPFTNWMAELTNGQADVSTSEQLFLEFIV